MDLNTSTQVTPVGMAWLRDDRHSLLLAGALWVLLVLMIVPEGFDYETLANGDSPTTGSTVSRLLWLGLLALSFVIVVWRAGLAWLLLRTVNPFLLLFVALAIVSVAWSIDASLSSRRLIRLATIVLTCSAFVLMSWHARRLQSVVRPILTIMLAGSIAFGFLAPELAIHQEASAELIGAWRGLANHKNGLGALACIAFIFWLHAGLTGEVKRFSAVVGGMIAAACLLLSRSSTSLAAAVFVTIFLVALLRSPQGLRPYVPYFVAVLALTLLIYALAILNLIPGLGTLLMPITALTDKGINLTGRTDIWAILVEHIARRPLLGSGYAAYWTAGPVIGAESYEFMWRMNAFYPGSAHNGYLEIANDLGLAGLACLLAYLAAYLRQSLQLLDIDRKQAALYLALFFQQAITNLSETHWFSVLSVDFVIMTLATVALARAVLQHRLHSVFGDPLRAIGTRAGDIGLPLAQRSFARTDAFGPNGASS